MHHPLFFPHLCWNIGKQSLSLRASRNLARNILESALTGNKKVLAAGSHNWLSWSMPPVLAEKYILLGILDNSQPMG